MPIRTQPKKCRYAGIIENNIGHRNMIGGFLKLLMSVSTTYVEGDGNSSFNSKYAVMWKLLCHITQLSISTHAQLQRHRLKFI